MKKLVIHLLIGLFFLCGLVACGNTQSSAEKQFVSMQVAEKVKSLRFKFEANYAYPTGYRSIYLSPYYDVSVSPDTIRAYLPYYGRAYRAPVNSYDSGLKFTSTQFDYQVTPGKKSGNWHVNIRTKDTGREIVLHFDIWDNSSARLNVTDADRQPISFQGDIEVEKQD